MGTSSSADTGGRSKGVPAKTAATTAAPASTPGEACGRTAATTRVGMLIARVAAGDGPR
jgi:hypothetical protein